MNDDLTIVETCVNPARKVAIHALAAAEESEAHFQIVFRVSLGRTTVDDFPTATEAQRAAERLRELAALGIPLAVRRISPHRILKTSQNYADGDAMHPGSVYDADETAFIRAVDVAKARANVEHLSVAQVVDVLNTLGYAINGTDRRIQITLLASGIASFRSFHNRRFPTWREVFAVAQAIGFVGLAGESSPA